jgi:hypothetical protein
MDPRPDNSAEDREALFEEPWTLAGEIKANMPDDVTSDHDWLSDDDGLPL